MCLAGGTQENKIKIWSLDDHSLVKTIDADISIHSLVMIDVEEKKRLIITGGEETIQLWNLNDYVCIKTIQGHSSGIFTMDVLQCDGNLCLVSLLQDEDDSVNIWDLQNEVIVKSIYYNDVISARVLKNCDQACMAIGDW